MKPRQTPWKWLVAGFLLILVAGVAFVLPRQLGTPPELRDRVAASLSEWTGGTVTLTEPLRVRYFPPSLQGGLVLSNATKLPAVQTVTAPNFKVSLGFLALLTGQIKLDALQLGKPTISLRDQPGNPPEEAPTHALLTSLLDEMPMETVRIRRGAIVTETGKQLVSKLDVRLNSRGRKGAMEVLSSFVFNGETVAFALDSGKITTTEDQRTAPVKLKLTSRPVTAKFSGTVRLGSDLEGTGEMETELPDARRFLGWVGVALPEGESLKNVTASGTVHWSGPTLTFDDGTFAFDGNEAIGLFAVTAGARPRIDGTLAFESLMLDPYIHIEPGEEGLHIEPGEEGLFDWALLKYLDADLRLSAGELFAESVKLGRVGFTIHAKNGKISSEIGELQVCGGQVAGRLELDLSKTRTEASLTGNLSNIEIETCLQPFALGIPLQGVGTLTFDISTGGTSRGELIRGLVGETRVVARDGVIPIDFSELIAKSSTDGHGWSADSGTAYNTLDADCSLSAGHLWCQSFRMQTPEGLVSGSGGLDVAQQRLDWDFLIADPVAPLNASQLVMESPPRVTLTGPLSAPQINRVNRPSSKNGSPGVDPGSASAAPR